MSSRHSIKLVLRNFVGLCDLPGSSLGGLQHEVRVSAELAICN